MRSAFTLHPTAEQIMADPALFNNYLTKSLDQIGGPVAAKICLRAYELAETTKDKELAALGDRLFDACVPPPTLTEEQRNRMKAIAPLAGQQAAVTPDPAPNSPERRMATLRQMASEVH